MKEKTEKNMKEEIQERRHQEEIVEQKWQDKITEQKPQEEIQIAERRRQEEIEQRKLERNRAVRRNPKGTAESAKTQPRYRGSMVAREILPNDTYRTSQLEPNNGRLYATTAYARQIKSLENWNEDDDDSSENSDDEPEMQRSKRTVRKPVRSGSFMQVR
ncbi:hypothetical protein AVEN_56666-1 [Araneus ventricosus]|uniref:Uncharacterized protein n=1 Tax=Araneus ventricosus TaxID=182803 RepID=A0A4Y2RVL4_ARAVE|nr:hypothetical protein AVEN_56666-1 [Araneus ventricosus]